MTNRRHSDPDFLTEDRIPPDHVGVLMSAVVMILFGWGGLYWLVTTQIPRIGGQLWIFFVLLHIAITGTAIPMVRYLNVRFTPINAPLPPGGIIVRQSVWIGLYAVICAWMQIPRVLTPLVALLLALVFIVIEVFLRMREIPNER
ncbi:MAG TPA: hypothetical protein VHL11_06915 [Phototrophicaceae bacterium]|jgi:hypothetical protein|nr:hypothetical protein [Phototrophicaceae bacterium]